MEHYEDRVLILDDDDANRLLLSVAVQMGGRLGYVEATTGTQALAVWQPGKFAFAFLDIEVPDMTGLEVARQMREQDKGIVIVMCSANDDPAVVQMAVRVGADMFFVKPFQLETLLSTVKILNRAALRSSPRVLIIDNTQRPRWEERPPEMFVPAPRPPEPLAPAPPADPT